MEPGGTTNEGNVQEQRSARNEQDQVMHEDRVKEVDTARGAVQDTSPVVDRTEGSVDAGKQWADQVHMSRRSCGLRLSTSLGQVIRHMSEVMRTFPVSLVYLLFSCCPVSFEQFTWTITLFMFEFHAG